MKPSNLLKTGLLTCAIALAMGALTVANAVPINITVDPGTGLQASDIDKGILGNNNPLTSFNFLQADISLYNGLMGTSLPSATYTGYGDFSTASVNVTGYSYAVIHYGTGPGGQGQGGGIVFYYLNNMTGMFSFPASGLGTNGYGGLSSVRLYGPAPTVPDGGTTVMLLGLGLTGLGAARRFIRR